MSVTGESPQIFMKLVALQTDSLKNRKFLRCESKTTDARCGQCNKAQDAGVDSHHILGSMAVQSKENVVTPSPVKGVLLLLVSRGTH